jgi:hypothetical protein
MPNGSFFAGERMRYITADGERDIHIYAHFCPHVPENIPFIFLSTNRKML